MYISCQLSEKSDHQVKSTIIFVSGITTPALVNHKRKYSSGNITEEMKVLYDVDISYMKSYELRSLQ